MLKNCHCLTKNHYNGIEKNNETKNKHCIIKEKDLTKILTKHKTPCNVSTVYYTVVGVI